MSVETNSRAVYGLASTSQSSSPGSGVWAFPTSATAKTADYTITTADGMIRVDCSAAARTITLPAASACFANGMGQVFTIKKIDSSANGVMLQTAAAGQVIDGFRTVTIALQYDCITVQSNGVNWDVISSN